MDCFLILLILILIPPSLSATTATNSPPATAAAAAKSSSNPFTEKAALLRYWKRKIPNSSPQPHFLVSKLTPLSISAAAKFSSLAASDPFKLSSALPSFCSSAALLCTPSLSLSLSLSSQPGDSAFSAYKNSNFSNYKASGSLSAFKNYLGDEVPLGAFTRYGPGAGGHNDSFAKYGPGNVDTGADFASYGSSSAEEYDRFNTYGNSTGGGGTQGFTNYANTASGGLTAFKSYFGNEVPLSTFSRYGHSSGGHDDSFTKYGPGNVDTGANFTSYGVNTAAGSDRFNTYGNSTNGAALGFTNYATKGTGRVAGFSHYSDDSNVGQQSFAGYGKGGSGTRSEFTTYAHKYSNIIESDFAHYGEGGVGNEDTFTTYSEHANIPDNHFQSYGSGTTAGIEKFSNYRHESNIGDDSFTSYEKGGDFGIAEFTNYGNESSGSDAFKGYGEGSTNGHITFTSYFEDNTTFKAYAKTGIDFKSYHNSSSSARIHTDSKPHEMHNWVEAGRFFRESSLKTGTVMPMPDIHDRMPPRSFLPRSIAGKIPFSVAAVTEIFKFRPGTAMAKAVASTLGDCDRPPSRGETKRCASSAEDMIDFAVSVLGADIEVRSTENTKGSKGNILIGEVKGVNGGAVTESVSCHQSLFPYLVYYCHAVPRVRVYEAEILVVDSKERINHGIAICHIDTSDWSATHGAFVALGPGPGKIEVCHWIFEGDMTWTVRDRA